MTINIALNSAACPQCVGMAATAKSEKKRFNTAEADMLKDTDGADDAQKVTCHQHRGGDDDKMISKNSSEPSFWRPRNSGEDGNSQAVQDSGPIQGGDSIENVSGEESDEYCGRAGPYEVDTAADCFENDKFEPGLDSFKCSTSPLKSLVREHREWITVHATPESDSMVLEDHVNSKDDAEVLRIYDDSDEVVLTEEFYYWIPDHHDYHFGDLNNHTVHSTLFAD